MKEGIRSPEDYDDDPYEVYDILRDNGFSITQLDPEGNRYGEHFICAER
jgi:hypothetical protein